MSVLGSNQLANLLSFTPGGIGVNQAFNSFALESYTSTTTATAYSLGQQLITTAFNVGFAIVLICVVFGWQGGSKLVRDSYDDAKVKKEEMSEQRHEKKVAKREARRTEGRKGLMRVFRRGDDDEPDAA
jgi:multisubunit Na+/H+ antiporter MnhC subunit